MASLKEKIGQMIMVGLQGEELTQEEERLLRDYPFGGFILFGHNLNEPKQILSLCCTLWERGKKAPPLIAIDLPPFIYACHNQMECLMTAHVLPRPGELGAVL